MWDCRRNEGRINKEKGKHFPSLRVLGWGLGEEVGPMIPLVGQEIGGCFLDALESERYRD